MSVWGYIFIVLYLWMAAITYHTFTDNYDSNGYTFRQIVGIKALFVFLSLSWPLTYLAVFVIGVWSGYNVIRK